MDLNALLGVLRRQSAIVAIGLGLAAFAALSLAMSIRDGGLAWRSPATYQAKTTLLVTQPGFPWGRSTLSESIVSGGGSGNAVPRFSDPTRMEYLASLYAATAERDAIRDAVGAALGIDEPAYEAVPTNGADQRPLPLFEIRSYAQSPDTAVALANRVAGAVRTSLEREQQANDIRKSDRVSLRVMSKAQRAEVFEGVRLTRPIMVFLLLGTLTVLAAFVVDNLRAGRRRTPASMEIRSVPVADPVGKVIGETEQHLAGRVPLRAAEKGGSPARRRGAIRPEPSPKVGQRGTTRVDT